MLHFHIESDIEKTPTILGIRAVFFFVFAGLSFLAIPIIIIGFSWIKAVIVILAVGALYVYLFYLTESFQQNKLGDDKMPNEITTNP